MLLALAMTVSILSSMGCAADAAPELGPVTSKDVVYQIITDRFYDGDTSNNTPDGFDPTLYDGTGSDLKLYQGGDWSGIIEKIPYLKGMGLQLSGFPLHTKTGIRKSLIIRRMAVMTAGPAFMAIMSETISLPTSTSAR